MDELGYFSGVTHKGHGMCYPVHIYFPDANWKVEHVMAAVGILSRSLNGPLPDPRRHISVNKMC